LKSANSLRQFAGIFYFKPSVPVAALLYDSLSYSRRKASSKIRWQARAPQVIASERTPFSRMLPRVIMIGQVNTRGIGTISPSVV